METRVSRTTGAKGIKFVQVVASYSKHQRAIIRNLILYSKLQIVAKKAGAELHQHDYQKKSKSAKNWDKKIWSKFGQ